MMFAFIVLLEVVLLELILSLSNVWFTTFLGDRLPRLYQEKARWCGLIIAWVIRITVVLTYSFFLDSHFTLDAIPGIDFYWIDIILLIGGAWILFQTVDVMFFNRGSREPANDYNMVLLQGAFISIVLSLDAVRTAEHYISDRWIASLLVIVTMLISAWLSPKIINRLHIRTKGLVILLFATGLLLLLEAFHQSILSELICFGAALYLMNVFLIPRYGKLPKNQ